VDICAGALCCLGPALKNPSCEEEQEELVLLLLSTLALLVRA
jgi:hypothetical protein